MKFVAIAFALDIVDISSGINQQTKHYALKIDKSSIQNAVIVCCFPVESFYILSF